MTDLNLFSKDDQSNAGNTTDETVNYAEQLIGEGKRYKDVAIAAKALVDKDNFIGRLQSELEAIRGQLKGEQKIDAFLDQVKNLKAPVVSPPSNSDNQTSENAGNQNINTQNSNSNTSLSVQDVEALLEKREQARTKQQNFNFAVEKVKEAFGADYKATLASITMNLGATPEFMNELAQTQPQAFLKLVGVSEQPTQRTATVPSSTIRTNGLVNSTANGEKTAKYYSELRKKMGNDAYFADKSLQNEIHRNAQRLGEAFFN